jgi:UDP-N-acetylmuramoyl-L-alanyl-D-glutamate--2,6-diaminopimelate ligase
VTLAELAAAVSGAEVVRGAACDVVRVTHDSRDVGPGALYVALPGQRVDGRRFIPQALEAGAVAIAGLPVCETDVPSTVGFLALPAPRATLGALAAAALGWPARAMTLVGITGTNGKTTTSTLIAQMCDAVGWSPGLIGTVVHRVGAEVEPALHTTPEAPDLQALFARMRAADVRLAAMEVSSIGLTEHRVGGLAFDVAAFLNLTPDHLDYHGTFDAYGEAKARLFRDHLASAAVAVVCVDDPAGEAMIAVVPPGRTVWRVSARPERTDVEVGYTTLSFGPFGIRGRLRTPLGPIDLETPLVGEFNAINVAVAVACARAAALPADAIAEGLRTARIRGRLERVPAPPGAPTVLVDYAHTPDALGRAIDAVRPFASGRVLVVFGCGGDRDRLKRPLMGAAAATADAVVVTTDNPRGEDPVAIADAALEGALAAGLRRVEAIESGGACVVLDRRSAIEAAIAASGPGDVVLIAGKGHETYQEVGGVRHPFDDLAVARARLEGTPA